MKIWSLGQISNEEKQNILSQHKEIYNGYKTLNPNVSNPQPLYVQDFAKDKVGAVINNKGNVKGYTNFGINEQKEELTCSECGGVMQEGECSECGWKGEVGEMEEYNTGKLSDIYNVQDLGDDEFDYVEGGGNKYGTFKKMQYESEMDEIDVKKLKKGDKYKFKIPDYEEDVVFSDEYDDNDDKIYKFKGDSGMTHMMKKSSMEKFLQDIEEQGMTGGGSSPDTSKSYIKPAYDFKSDGPMDAFPTEELDEMYMESAWDDEIEEANDISGVQGVYGDMEPPYDFDSEGPGKAGPYQRSSWSGFAEDEPEENELEIDFEKFDPRDKSWEEITAYTGEDEFSNLVDEDLKESFLNQKKKIQEMFDRFKKVK
jgi:hypothetical protein